MTGPVVKLEHTKNINTKKSEDIKRSLPHSNEIGFNNLTFGVTAFGFYLDDYCKLYLEQFPVILNNQEKVGSIKF